MDLHSVSVLGLYLCSVSVPYLLADTCMRSFACFLFGCYVLQNPPTSKLTFFSTKDKECLFVEHKRSHIPTVEKECYDELLFVILT